METFLIRALQVILCISLLIFLHEGGHFLFAKLFKIRVEKFCLFFDPWKTLFKFKPKKSDTEYCLGWLPLGGYVKIAGMIDESMDKEQMKLPPQPWEFRSHPAWQRLLVMAGGVLVNFLVALLLYSMILFWWGDTYVPTQSMTYGMQFNKEAKALGFQDGDILLRTDKKEFKNFDTRDGITNAYRDMSEAQYVDVLRNGTEKRIQLPADGLNMLQMFKSNPPFMLAYFPSVIDSVVAKTPAAQAGVEKGDQIVAFNKTPIATWNDYNRAIMGLSDRLKGAPTDDSLAMRHVVITVQRARTAELDTLSLMLDEELKMGVIQKGMYQCYKPSVREYSFLESFPAGISHGVAVLEGYLQDFKYLFSKEGASSVGSFGAIGSMFPTTWNWHRFWELTAFISIMLAFMNILPIPALDGGHILFVLIEIVTRRKPSEKFMERAEMVGLSFLVLLMIWAVKNDIVNFLL